MRARDTQRWARSVAAIRGLLIAGAVACSLSTLAHESSEHSATTHPDTSASRVAIDDLTYAGRVDRVIGGQPFRTVGRLLLGQDALQLSEVRSDGRLVSLRTATSSLTAPRMTRFEPVDSGIAADVQVESLPSLLVMAQTGDGVVRLYDRTRFVHDDHPYQAFVAAFDERFASTQETVARAGVYLQVLPYAGEGPADFAFASAPDEVLELTRQPFKFHYRGDRNHVVVSRFFVVVPKSPVLVDVEGERFVFYAYALKQ
ncbi:MAG: hypothetical protein AB8G17_16855 [Gammaproteobacteria bacterium]